jgi:hypothetical protein
MLTLVNTFALLSALFIVENARYVLFEEDMAVPDPIKNVLEMLACDPFKYMPKESYPPEVMLRTEALISKSV